jgi:hypothetical protein
MGRAIFGVVNVFLLNEYSFSSPAWCGGKITVYVELKRVCACASALLVDKVCLHQHLFVELSILTIILPVCRLLQFHLSQNWLFKIWRRLFLLSSIHHGYLSPKSRSWAFLSLNLFFWFDPSVAQCSADTLDSNFYSLNGWMTLPLFNICTDTLLFFKLLQLKWLNQELIKIWPFVNEVLIPASLKYPCLLCLILLLK